MKEEAYLTLVDRLCIPGSPQEWKRCFITLPDLTMVQRKAMANLCRSQHVPDPGTQLHYLLCSKIPPSLLKCFSSFIEHPFSAGLLMSMLRLAPLSTEIINSTYLEAIEKERKTMDSSPLTSNINYNVWFGNSSESIGYPIPPNPQMSQTVRSAIDMWKERETSYLHFPKLSKKSISDDTSRLVASINSEYTRERLGRGVSQVEVERIYHETGIQVEGWCEMRQKWYPSGLTPRTYYAAGGEAFHRSKWLSRAWTSLADTLPCTNRATRVLPTRLSISDGGYAFIYDLSSFTSNLHEHKHFLSRLALYCRGTMIPVVDAWEGVIYKDLGEEIDRYNALNDEHLYSLSRVYDSAIPPLAHHTAGYLGVYGNIATSTFLHGSTMLQLCSSTTQLNVAGDDGIVDTDNDDEPFSLLRYLGLMELSKSFRTHELGCIHLKRPLRQFGNRLYQGSLVLWPSFEFVVGRSGSVDDRYPFIAEMDFSEKQEAVANSITTFLTSLSSYTDLQEWMVDAADSVIKWCYSVMLLPYDGYVPQVHGSTYGFVPVYDKAFVGIEPKRNTLQRCYVSCATMSVRGKVDVDRTKGYLECDDILECNSTPGLSYIEAMGYIERKRLTHTVFGEYGLELLLKEYFEPIPPVYSYTVLRDVPQWLHDVI